MHTILLITTRMHHKWVHKIEGNNSFNACKACYSDYNPKCSFDYFSTPQDACKRCLFCTGISCFCTIQFYPCLSGSSYWHKDNPTYFWWCSCMSHVKLFDAYYVSLWLVRVIFKTKNFSGVVLIVTWPLTRDRISVIHKDCAYKIRPFLY